MGNLSISLPHSFTSFFFAWGIKEVGLQKINGAFNALIPLELSKEIMWKTIKNLLNNTYSLICIHFLLKISPSFQVLRNKTVFFWYMIHIRISFFGLIYTSLIKMLIKCNPCKHVSAHAHTHMI